MKPRFCPSCDQKQPLQSIKEQRFIIYCCRFCGLGLGVEADPDLNQNSVYEGPALAKVSVIQRRLDLSPAIEKPVAADPRSKGHRDSTGPGPKQRVLEPEILEEQIPTAEIDEEESLGKSEGDPELALEIPSLESLMVSQGGTFESPEEPLSSRIAAQDSSEKHVAVLNERLDFEEPLKAPEELKEGLEAPEVFEELLEAPEDLEEPLEAPEILAPKEPEAAPEVPEKAQAEQLILSPEETLPSADRGFSAMERLILVEGSESLRQSSRELLKERGLAQEILEYSTGISLIQGFSDLLKEERPSKLIIMELNLSDLDGKEVAFALRAMEAAYKRKRCPILFFSAPSDASGLKPYLKELGGARHLPKQGTENLELAELLASTVRRFLG